MAWKVFIVSFLAVGVAAAHNATEAQSAKIIAEFQMPEMLKDVIKAEVSKDCESANAVDKTEDASGAVIKFCDCAFRLFADDSFSLTKLTTALEEGKAAQFWKKNCDKSLLIRKCLADFVEGYSPCAQKDLMKSIAILRKDFESVLDFACFNDGERLIKLTTQEVIICILTKQDSLRECHNKIEKSSNYMDAVKNMSSEKVCTKVNEASTCVADVLRECETPAPSDFLDAFAKHFKQNSGTCRVNQGATGGGSE